MESDKLHPETAYLLDKFAVALKNKALSAQVKYGYTDNWRTDYWREELVEQLLDHVKKGDPRDVALYCAFAWGRGWPTTRPKDVSYRAEELLASNNELLERARKAEREVEDLTQRLRMAEGRLHEIDNPRPTHKHKKRGTYYRIMARLTVQAARPIYEGDVLVGYVGEHGDCWARLEEEFNDGRFSPVAQPIPLEPA